mmetsp:Transcript_19903/g.45955  ORF Transcript_19903/g.45955 Transcript_19903/m.45955 type:complete len:281 (+) Transcript_19903:63-905(+)
MALRTACCVALALLPCLVGAAERRPVIAIYPTEDDWYLVAYQEWLAAAGASSYVMPWKAKREEVDKIFDSVNGFLIPGGGDPVGATVTRMVERAVKANAEGDYFPVWGTCLGFEWIVDIFAGYASIKSNFDSEELASALNFTDSIAESRTYAGLDSNVMNGLTNQANVWYMHHKGIEPEKARHHKGFMEVFNILSTSLDRKGRPYVAQIEGKALPIYANQFHPEKIEYAKGPGVPETQTSIGFARHLAKFFVEEAKKSSHIMSDDLPLVNKTITSNIQFV